VNAACECHAINLIQDSDAQDRTENIIFLRKLVEVYQIPVTTSYAVLIENLIKQLEAFVESYLATHNAGDAGNTHAWERGWVE